jgi:predicted DCC family thiol-disulfide oxidoreductase YuxK
VSNGWTGGQYSVYRVLFALYLLVHFSMLWPFAAEVFSGEGMLAPAAASPLYPLFPNPLFVWDAPIMVHGLLAVGIAASVTFGLGWGDRVAAVVLWFVWACLFTRNPLISNPGLPFVGWLLLAHAILPRAPYGAWAARGRTDPGGGWAMPPMLFGAAWVVMAVGYSYSGMTKLSSPSWIDGSALAHVLANPLARPTALREILLGLPPALLAIGTWGALATELLFAPLALFARVRPFLWLVMVGMHLGLMTLVDFADLTIGMLFVHFFTFDPAWVPARRTASPTLVFYDGSCGLCHGTVRFLLAEDAEGSRFRFAPLDSDAFRRALASPGSGYAEGDPVPDSVLVRRPGEALLSRSDGVLELGRQLGGLWRLGAGVGRAVPRPIRDAIYDFVARHRQRLFARPADACPILPPALRERFLA